MPNSGKLDCMKKYANWHPNFPVNLDNCKDEPIHIPGAVQPFGILIAFDGKTGQLVAVSENFIGMHSKVQKVEDITSLKISDLVRFHGALPSGVEALQRKLMKTSIILNGIEKNLYGVVYGHEGLKILEIELKSDVETISETQIYLSNLPTMMNDIRNLAGTQELANFAAARIRSLTGFDRVMIYKYDDDWNGEVIAEEKEEKLETFLGLHYPASDIPAQARALYERNWIRSIPTIHYKPAVILPKVEQRMDLSDSVIRSVSPIHIRYLDNMGVTASMSISLIVDGKLWGLIACHHYSGEKYIPLNIRLGCEAYGQLISWHIKSLEASSLLKKTKAGESKLHSVLSRFSSELDFTKAANDSSKELLELFDSNSVVIRLGDQVVTIGKNPGEMFSATIAKELLNRPVLEPLAVTEASAFGELKDINLGEEFAGFMALSLSDKHNYYIICTRPEEKTTVNWAGNPHTKLNLDFNDPQDRLLPRGSFALWQEQHEGKSKPWTSLHTDLLKRFALLFVKIVIERKEVVEKSNEELRALNRAKDEFVATVSHELRTPLNAIIGWTDLALSKGLTPDRYPEAFKIIQRNARSQNQLVSDLLDVSRIISGKMKLSARNMRVSEVVEAVILSFSPATEAKGIKVISHLDEDSDSIIGDPNRIQQVVWNLVSNAVKFSRKGSKIWITVRRVSSHIEIEVRDEGEGISEENLSKIFGRFEQVDSSVSRKAGGLGLGLAIAKHIVELHGGRITAKSDGLGLGTSFSVHFPISPLKPETSDDKMPIDDTRDDKSVEVRVTGTSLKGQTILVVEDEIDASNFLQLLLQGQGAKTYSAHNGIDALEVLSHHKDEISIILSDVGMPVMDGYQFIAQVRKSPDPVISSMSAVALTAFGRPHDRIAALRAGFDAYIAKPVMQEELLAVLEGSSRSKFRR